jgi:Homing endonuclease associated repeat
MAKLVDQKSDVVDAIRNVASQLGRAPSRSEFRATAGMTEYQILTHFPSWREALRASGIEYHPTVLLSILVYGYATGVFPAVSWSGRRMTR